MPNGVHWCIVILIVANSTARKKIVYLDLCAYNRPFDDQSQSRIALETNIVIHVLEHIESGVLKVIASDALHYENERNPDPERRDRISRYFDLAYKHVPVDSSVIRRAGQLYTMKFSDLDALHIACAEKGRAAFFLTCDDTLIRKAEKNRSKIKTKVMGLLQFLTTKEKK